MATIETFRKSDDIGNVLSVRKARNGDMYIYLKISGERGPSRLLGYVDVSHRMFVTIRKRELHLHRKSNSYGFNEYLVRHAKTFDVFALKDEYGTYYVPVKVVEEEACYLQFKQQGFEKQRFLNLSVIEQYKGKPLV